MGVGDIVFFIVSWWIVLFVLLPIKVEVHDNPPVGIASSSPVKSYLLVKLIIATLISAILTVLYVYLKIRGYINFEAIYDFMSFV
ncbi:MAG: DUF1467 family protein [Ehrlichia sp.]